MNRRWTRWVRSLSVYQNLSLTHTLSLSLSAIPHLCQSFSVVWRPQTTDDRFALSLTPSVSLTLSLSHTKSLSLSLCRVVSTNDQRWNFSLFLIHSLSLSRTFSKDVLRPQNTDDGVALSLVPTPSLTLTLYLSRSLSLLLSLALALSRSLCLHNQDGTDGTCRLVLPIERTGNGGCNGP